MAIGNETVTVAVCDACGHRTYGEPGQQPKVLSGSVTNLTAAVEVNAKWSACRPQHVGKAAMVALDNARSNKVTSIAPVSAPAWSTPSAGG